MEPTIFADVSNQATIAREENLCPVLSIIKYRDQDEAVKIANDSDYGLGGTVCPATPSVRRRSRGACRPAPSG